MTTGEPSIDTEVLPEGMVVVGDGVDRADEVVMVVDGVVVVDVVVVVEGGVDTGDVPSQSVGVAIGVGAVVAIGTGAAPSSPAAATATRNTRTSFAMINSSGHRCSGSVLGTESAPAAMEGRE